MRFVLVFAVTAFLSLQAVALTLKGIDLPETVTLENQQFVLNGAGVRTKFFIDAYVAALYLPAKSQDANSIVDADSPMAIRLTITSGMISGEVMSDSTRDGFVRSTGGNIAPIESEINAMIGAFKDEIKEGDTFDLVYLPGSGVQVYRNGEKKASAAGMPFKKAMFGIWLSERNIQKSLRKGLLGS